MTEAAILEATAPELPEGPKESSRSLTSDAWRSLRSNPVFWVSAGLISVFVLMAIWPSLFTNTDPREAILADSRSRPGDGTWFGRDIQGYDIYARCVYGARASILVGLFTTILTVLIGGLIGIMSGYLGGAWDATMSRIGDVFFAIPLLLGAIIFLVSLPDFFNSNAFLAGMKVVLALAVLGWPSMARLMRSSVIQVKPNDYVQAARALGASPARIIRSHVLPNSIAPLIVFATISLGVYISVEATLSFLGIGLQAPAVSWGIDISSAIVGLRTTPHMLFFPSLFLSLAVLGFILLGDAVRDALDPKNR